MAKVRNVSGVDLVVPELRFGGGLPVANGEVVEVPDDRLAAYLEQPGTWRDESAPAVPAPKPAVTTTSEES